MQAMTRQRQLRQAFISLALVVAEAASSKSETPHRRRKHYMYVLNDPQSKRHQNNPNGWDQESDDTLFRDPQLASLSQTSYPSPSSLPSSSSAPTGSPSLSVSPSFMPSFSTVLTEGPSRSVVPTYLSTINCLINGFYGATSNETVDLEFQYQIEFTTGGDLNGTLLPALGARISHSILPVLFPFVCGTKHKRRMRHPRKVQVVGLSRLPEEAIMKDVNCAVTLENNETNGCAVMSGSISLFLDGPEHCEEVPVCLSALNTIRGHMMRGEYNDAHDHIVKITFLELDASTLSQAPKTTSSGGSDGGFECYWLLLIAMSALWTILRVILLWRRQTKVDNEKKEEDDEHLIVSKHFHKYPESTKDKFSVLTD